MSYCRISSDSDLYVYPTVNGKGEKVIVCLACDLSEFGESVLHGNADAIRHLLLHYENDEKVPERVFLRLIKEMYGSDSEQV